MLTERRVKEAGMTGVGTLWEPRYQRWEEGGKDESRRQGTVLSLRLVGTCKVRWAGGEKRQGGQDSLDISRLQECLGEPGEGGLGRSQAVARESQVWNQEEAAGVGAERLC